MNVPESVSPRRLLLGKDSFAHEVGQDSRSHREAPPGVARDSERRALEVLIEARRNVTGRHEPRLVIEVEDRSSAPAHRQDAAVHIVADEDADDDERIALREAIDQYGRKFPVDAYRMIHTVSPFVLGKRAIRDKATQRLPDFEHDGIDDGPVGERSETMYYHAGAWIQAF